MPLTYEILPDVNLVYVRYWGVTSVEETFEVFGRYARDPGFRQDHKHLVDLSRIVEYERSFPKLMKLQAQKADTLVQPGPPNLMVYYAPTRLSMSLARIITKSWDGLGNVVPMIAEDEGQALTMLGLSQETFADLPMKDA